MAEIVQNGSQLPGRKLQIPQGLLRIFFPESKKHPPFAARQVLPLRTLSNLLTELKIFRLKHLHFP
jgi:hypothetical protein